MAYLNRYLVTISALGLIACDSESDDSAIDAGSVQPGVDAAGSTEPTTVPSGSSATLPVDAGVSPLDAGVSPLDAAVSPLDAGSVHDSGLDAAVKDAAAAANLDSGPDASDAGDGGNAPRVPDGAVLPFAAVADGFVAWRWASGVVDPRGITVDHAGNVLVVSRADESIVKLWDANADGLASGIERATIATAPGLAHGIALNGGYLYASSASTVYRFEYDEGRVELDPPTAIVTAIADGGRHTSRTLLFDDIYLYVTVGSGDNVDVDSSRAQIRRFPIVAFDDGALSFAEGELFADGLRNEVGIALDEQGRVWGVENGRDELVRTDLGGDIHVENPGEELNLFDEPGEFYGFPYCWSEGILDGGAGPGTQWADPDNTTHDDEWCRNADNVVPPVLVLDAHTAPLDILFYRGAQFPDDYSGDAIVTLHGSWNRPLGDARGYKVVRLPFRDDGMPTGEILPLLEFSGEGDRPIGDAGIETQWPIRPVGLGILPNGTLLISSDASDEILAVGYIGE
jgi:glucose/arabinose dehydrogenase